MRVRGTVINIHHHGGTVRLEDGTLAAITETELLAHRPRYVSAHAKREALELLLDWNGRHATVTLEPPPPVNDAGHDAAFEDTVFEARIGAYLKSTQEWAPPDQAPPAERHFIRKKRRARLFEARPDTA